jgi:hypothetical protein
MWISLLPLSLRGGDGGGVKYKRERRNKRG